MIRCSISGTTASALASWSATSASVASGSKRRRSTIVEPSGRLRTKCAIPHEWNRGAAITVVPRARSGIASRIAAAGASDPGWLRCAPFGVPVVPLVRITVRPGSSGASRPALELPPIRSSSVGTPSAPPSSEYEMKLVRPSAAPATSSANSSS